MGDGSRALSHFAFLIAQDSDALTPGDVRIIGLQGLPEIRPGDNLAELIGAAAGRGPGLEAGDVVVVTQKVVSKAEGRAVTLADVTASPEAERLARDTD